MSAEDRLSPTAEPNLRHGVAKAPPDRELARWLGPLVLVAATLGGVIVCILLAAPFLEAFTWALTLAILFAPLHAWLETRLKHANPAAIVSILIIVVVVSAPLAFVGERLVQEGAAGASLVQARIGTGDIQHFLDNHPRIAPLGSWIEQHFDLPAMAASVAASLSNVGASFARGSILKVIEILVTFYLLYFFLRDRKAAGRLLQDWLPLSRDESRHLFKCVSDTVHATIYGTLAMAVVQGVLGGLMFWLVGLSTPLFWGLVMGLLTIVPMVGAFIVWLPVAAVLALQGEWVRAVVLSLFGVIVVIGGIHNVMYPMLVGNRLRLHAVPAFISMIGGLIVFGAAGFILGPVVLTVTIFLFGVWRDRARGHAA